jgi:hypothetical protein
VVCLLALFCLLGGMIFPAVVSASPVFKPAHQQICEDTLAEFRANPGWLSELRDPILKNAEEIRDRVNRYGVLFRCMSTGGISMSGDMLEVNRLVTLFMLFAGGSLFPEAQSEARNYTLAFNDIQDPAVKILRDELSIPAPPGYVYIWLYPSQGSLPKALREYVNSSSVRGLTLQSRYIIVFDQVRAGMAIEEYERSQRSAVLSHEFVHAYIKSYLGPRRGFSLPTWYDEGLAIYLSGSSDPSSATYFDEHGRQVTWSVPPKDYARYRDDFDYLEQRLGHEQLMALIRRSILENAPEVLLQGVGQISEEDLYKLAEASRIRRGLNRLGLIFGIPAAVGLAYVLLRVVQKRRADHYWRPTLENSVGSTLKSRAVMAMGHSRELASPETEVARLIHQVQLRDDLDADQSMRKRYFAALKLAYRDEPEAAEALLGALTDECAVVRAAAARGLGEWSARRMKSAKLDAATRGLILNGLFPLLDRDPTNEARWAAAEAIYQVSGDSGLRPIRAAVRRWSKDSSDLTSALHQGWYIQWAVSIDLPQLLVDAYTWSTEDTRQAIISHLRRMPEGDRETCLNQARQSSDPYLRDLPEAVLRAD